LMRVNAYCCGAEGRHKLVPLPFSGTAIRHA
jgi:hypothetical protein